MSKRVDPVRRLLMYGSLLACGVAAVGAVVSPRITRNSLQSLERGTDFSFETVLKEDPMSILGSTRAVYLDGYGIVFSAEVELVPRLTPNPFRPAFTKEELARNKETKRTRVAFLKDHMRNMLVDYATKLDTIPLNDNVALAVTIPYSKVEDATGMPRQIVMSAPRKALLEAKTGRGQSLSANLKMQELF